MPIYSSRDKEIACKLCRKHNTEQNFIVGIESSENAHIMSYIMMCSHTVRGKYLPEVFGLQKIGQKSI